MTDSKSPIDTAQELFTLLFRRRADFTLLLTDAQLLSRKAAPCTADDWWYRYCCQRTNRDPSKEWTSFEFEETLAYKHAEPTARLQVSRCFNRQAWSVCVRWKPPADSQPDPPRDSLLVDDRRGHLPLTSGSFGEHTRPAECLSALSPEIVTYLDTQIRRDEAGPQKGLIVVTGATNSGKSEVARGLAWAALPRSKRRPAHLVTCEGPVEKDFWKKDAFKLDASAPLSALPEIDYTPRQLGSDCGSWRRRSPTPSGRLRLCSTPASFAKRRSSDRPWSSAAQGTSLLPLLTPAASWRRWQRRWMLSMRRRAGTRAIHVPKLLCRLIRVRYRATAYIPGRELFSTSAVLFRRCIGERRSGSDLVADGLFVRCCLTIPNKGRTRSQHGTLGRTTLPALDDAWIRHRDTPLRDPMTPLLRHLLGNWRAVREVHFRGDVDHEGVVPLIDMALQDDLYVG